MPVRRARPFRPLSLSAFAGAAAMLFGLVLPSAAGASAAAHNSPSDHSAVADASVVRSCQAANLRLVPGIIRGAPHGDLTIGLFVRNASRSACQIPTPPAASSIVTTASGPPIATTAGNGATDLTLGVGRGARTSIRWSNWCGGGLTQWGVRLRFSGQQRSVYALVIDNVAAGSMGSVIPPVPSCRQGGRSLATIAPFVST